jgi:hypothetical protein
MLDSQEIRAILARPNGHADSGSAPAAEALAERRRQERIALLKEKINSSSYMDLALTRLANDLAKALF